MVVPGEEAGAECSGVGERTEARREAGLILHGLNCASEYGLSSEMYDRYLRGASVDEREQIPGQWDLQHDVPGQRVRAVEGQAHAHRMSVQ